MACCDDAEVLQLLRYSHGHSQGLVTVPCSCTACSCWVLPMRENVFSGRNWSPGSCIGCVPRCQRGTRTPSLLRGPPRRGTKHFCCGRHRRQVRPCSGLFYCGEKLIEILSPKTMVAARDDGAVAGILNDAPWASVLTHELTHAAYQRVTCHCPS